MWKALTIPMMVTLVSTAYLNFLNNSKNIRKVDYLVFLLFNCRFLAPKCWYGDLFCKLHCFSEIYPADCVLLLFRVQPGGSAEADSLRGLREEPAFFQPGVAGGASAAGVCAERSGGGVRGPVSRSESLPASGALYQPLHAHLVRLLLHGSRGQALWQNW